MIPRVLVLLAVPFVFTGCVSSKYKLADRGTMPPPALNLHVIQPPVELMLSAVITFQGPGSWKRDAYWDEYVLTVANRSESPLAIESASLIGRDGQAVAPGANPWTLEKKSRTPTATLSAVAEDSPAKPGNGGSSVLASGALTVLLGPIGAIAGGGYSANVVSREAIEREFNRRRLALPATLAPGQIAPGSFFFPIMPGPRRLALRCRVGGESREVAIDLTPLADLHRKPASAATTPANASSSLP